ncbi:MAG: DUF1569 domain-containing protein [Phycisphaerales bacterium]|nr:DUF1569 domain-containing protein [Phycisphaerales bacterium]
MPINTKTAPHRLPSFHCTGCLKSELDRVQSAADAGTLITTGNWNAGEILDHCAKLFETGLDGSQERPPIIARLFGFLLKGKIFRSKSMPAGYQLPKHSSILPTEGVTFEQGMQRMRRVLARLDAGEAMTMRSPFLGAMTHEKWMHVNLIHSQLHIGFITYPGAV